MLRNILFDSEIPIDPQNVQDIVYAAQQRKSISPYSLSNPTIGALNPRLTQQNQPSNRLPDRLALSTLSDLAQYSRNYQ